MDTDRKTTILIKVAEEAKNKALEVGKILATVGLGAGAGAGLGLLINKGIKKPKYGKLKKVIIAGTPILGAGLALSSAMLHKETNKQMKRALKD